MTTLQRNSIAGTISRQCTTFEEGVSLMTKARAALNISLALFVMMPFGCRQSIEFRTRGEAMVVQKQIDDTHLMGESPTAVIDYLDSRGGFDHLTYVHWSPDPDEKRTLLAWTTKDLGKIIHPTWLVAVGCVSVKFRFDVNNRLTGYSVEPGLRGDIDM
jgi:hypothetical protein